MQSSQIFFTGPATAELTPKTLPALEPDQVLVEMDYTAISAGTERDNLLGRPNTSGRFPVALGYSGAGKVSALGGMVQGVSVGDRVLVIWGYHASHCIVKANQLVKIDDDRIDPLEAAFVFIASFPLAGLRKTRLEIGESVLVMGLGLLGVLAVRLARLAGGVPVIAADIREDRRKAALELGADYAFSPESPEFPAMEQSTTPTLLILILTCKGHFDYTDPRTSYGAPQYSRY